MKTIKRARPNGWLVEIVQYSDDPAFYILEYDDEGYPMDPDEGFGTLSEATTVFNKIAKELSDTPNWEMQARYDQEHGTINGYAPWQSNSEY
jgi:hypothetical protein